MPKNSNIRVAVVNNIFVYRKETLLGTVPTSSMFADQPLNYVAVTRRELTAPKSVKKPTGPSRETDSVTSTGAGVTNVEKRTMTGRSSPFKTKDSVSEPRN